MSAEQERLAAIVAGLIPEGAVLVRSEISGGWWRSRDAGLSDSIYDASLWDCADPYIAEYSMAGDPRAEYPEAQKHAARSALAADPIPTGSIVELMVMRIAELDDERSILREVVGLHPDSPVSLAMQIAGLAVDVKRLQGMLAQSQAENATLRAILASVPAPEDEP
jgi:hypothetical protein